MYGNGSKTIQRHLPKRNAKAPDSLCLKTITLRHAGPAVQRRQILAQILTDRLRERMSGRNLNFLSLVVNDVAIQV